MTDHPSLETSRTEVPEAEVKRFSFVGLLAGTLVSLAFLIALSLIAVRLNLDPAVQSGRLLIGIVMVSVPFLAFLVAAYVAGRVSPGYGLLQGLLIVLLAGMAFAAAIYALRSGSTLPSALVNLLPGGRVPDHVTVSSIPLMAAILGSTLGGILGGRSHKRTEWKAHRAKAIEPDDGKMVIAN